MREYLKSLRRRFLNKTVIGIIAFSLTGVSIIVFSLNRKQEHVTGGHRHGIAHRKELIDQAAARLDEHGLSTGIIMAGYKPAPIARVQVARDSVARPGDFGTFPAISGSSVAMRSSRIRATSPTGRSSGNVPRIAA